MNDISDIFTSMDYGKAPEGRGEADAWLTQHDSTFGLFINGEWHSTKKHFASNNPADNSKLADIGTATETQVEDAVSAARKAQKKWAAMGGKKRARYLYALARLVQKHARLLAVVESLDNGKTIRETRDIDIPLVARHFYHHAGWAQIQDRDLVDQEPLGVCGQIIPWNFPLLMLAWKIAPAIAAGNTVVLKPAEYTSLSALLFAELCQQAGLPKGVVNIVTGDGKIGEMIVNHPDVDKIAFTGSTDVGRLIRRATAGTGKKLTLELGGKSAFILFDDADIDSAIEGVVDAIWFNQGQVCCAGSRLLVQEKVLDKVIRRLKARMEKLRIGDPLDKSMDVGAVVDPVQRDRIASLVDQGIKEGATAWQASGLPDQGCYYPPTMLTGVEAADMVAQEEIFGPVLTVMSFRTVDEAIALANNSRYGLSCSIWSENINQALYVAPKVRAGVVWINATNLFDAAVGFGGVKESGFGREGGREGYLDYLKPKALAAQKKDATTTRIDKPVTAPTTGGGNGIDRTAKLYIGGKQARPDSGYSRLVHDHKGKLAGELPAGNRKDIRNAVEAMNAATTWSTTSSHNRAQVLYYIGENLHARAGEFAARLQKLTGASKVDAAAEVDLSIDRWFTAAAHADKYDGNVHQPPLRGMAVATHEPTGKIGILCPDEQPLLAMSSLAAPALAMGNRITLVPSPLHGLLATDFYQVLETSDMPGGAFNIVTGDRNDLAKTLADHLDVDAIWYFGDISGQKLVEEAAAQNLKRVFANDGKAWSWQSDALCESDILLRQAVEVKNIWVPWGE